jgi:autophagy-related protein 2
MLLYDGYDWPKTRRTIEEQVTQMRKRLAKIKHLVANGQVQEPIEEDTGALLFNSVYIGLPEDVDIAEPEALIAAIDEELRDDFETGTQSSWQSLKHPASQPRQPSIRVHGKKLARSKVPSIEFCLQGLNAEFNQYGGDNVLVSRTFVTVRDLEILDHIKTSTWKKFLTPLRSDSKGNIRETGANMVRIELHNVRPAPGHPSQEARLRVSSRLSSLQLQG